MLIKKYGDDLHFFPTPADFRLWLEKNHDKFDELWVAYFKKATGKPSITWTESVEQALCFGWIDGIRYKVDEEVYKIRFTPRKTGSHWSRVNVDHVRNLKKKGLMHASGLSAFNKRKKEKTAQATYEKGEIKMDPSYEKQIKSNKAAWEYYQQLTPSVRKQYVGWVMSAKKEETRINRLTTLIDSSAKGKLIPPLKWMKNR